MASVAGLSERRLASVRGRLEAFADGVFDGALQRSEQRRWGGVYLRGLMLDGKRKSIEPMAARLADGDEQCLQQFVNQSPWDEQVVRANLARRVCAEIEPDVWVIDDTGFAKQGRWSVGVARQYSGTLGRAWTTARSGCRSAPPATRRHARSTGGSSCPRSGTQTPSGAPRRTCPTACVIVRSGGWRWT
jgi:hypothetical protein